MTVADIPATLQVRTSTVENALTLQQLEEWFDVTPATLAAAMAGSARGWVSEVDGQVVGFTMGNADSGELTVLAVLPDYEGRGIGSALLAQMERWLFASGHRQIFLYTQPDPALRAYTLYVARGWQPTGEIHDSDEKFVKDAALAE